MQEVMDAGVQIAMRLDENKELFKDSKLNFDYGMIDNLENPDQWQLSGLGERVRSLVEEEMSKGIEIR